MTRLTRSAWTLALVCLPQLGLAQNLPAAKPVTLNTFDGHTLFGDYYAPLMADVDAPVVILLHMYGHDRKSWAPLIPLMHDEGFAILAIDLRGHGESATEETAEQVERRDSKLFRDMYQDLRAAYDWIATQKRVDRSRFALVGASVGGSVALRYAAKDRSVDAIVALSPGANYLGLNSERDIRRIQGRKLLLIATGDERRAAENLAARTQGAKAVIFEHPAAHGTDMFGPVSGVEQRIVRFLRRSVGRPTDTTRYGSINSNVFHKKGSQYIDRIKPTNMRLYSSDKEAISRGLRPPATRRRKKP